MMQRVLQQAELMDRMMHCIGVEPVRAGRIEEGMAWYEARSRCIACIHDQRCRDWLAARQGTSQPEPPGFCQNAEFFRSAKQPRDVQQMEESHEPAHANMGSALATPHAQPPRTERA
jgi:hypothetical protein